MDLVAGTPRVIVLTDHVAKDGTSKIVEKCDLPLTGVGVVNRIITDRAVFDIENGSLTLRGVAPGESVETIKEITAAEFAVDMVEDLKA